jgi:cytochrome c-type biogenesis protein CcmE
MRTEYKDELGDDAYHDLGDLKGAPDNTGINVWLILVGLLMVALLAGFIVSDGLEAETYFYSVDEAVAEGSELVGQTVRIKGQVEAGTIKGKPGTLGRTFRIAEKGKSIWVSYDGVLPDTFKEGVEVVAQGTVNEDYKLVADQVLVKCPSRYEGGPSSHPEDIPKMRQQASR